MREKEKKRKHRTRTKKRLKFQAGAGILSALGGLLGEQVLVDVGQYTALGDGDVTEELVQFLIVADGELEMTGDDTRLLVVAGGVASQFEDFSSQILKHGSEIYGST